MTAKQIRQFKAELVEVFRKHGLALGYEDVYGNLEIVPLTESLVRRIEEAV